MPAYSCVYVFLFAFAGARIERVSLAFSPWFRIAGGSNKMPGRLKARSEKQTDINEMLN